MGAAFEFLLFGPVEALRADGRVTLGEPRQRCVAAVLLIEANRVVPAGSLIERVWGEQPPASARSALYSYLTRIKAILRRLDPDGRQVRLTRAAGGYLLEIDPDLVDLHRFGRLVDQARNTRDLDQAAAVWRAALDLWRGDPCEDLTSPWLDQMRGTLEQQRLAAMSERNDVELARGRHAQLLAELTDQCQRQPFDERLAGQLMLAAYRCGRQAEALDHYLTVRRRLAEELGVDPGQALSTLYEQILRQDPALDLPPSRTPGWAGVTPAQLLADVPGFAGRAEALAALDELLTSAEHQPSTVVISAVSGTAGVGKTALAVHWAHRVADRFPDGQLYVNLRGFDRRGRVMDPAEAVRGFLDAFGTPPERIPSTLDAQTALYRRLVAGRRMLVVLDNARDAEQVRPLLPGTPTALAVVTSRNQLTSLVAVDGAQPLTLDVLSTVEAEELLTRRLGADRVRAEPSAVEAIISACARLPLALAIAAARALQTGFPLAALAAELGHAGGRLDALDAGEPTSQLRAVFSWSYATLTPAAARLFRLLGLHPGPDISVPAAISLTGRAEPETRRLLTELNRANLLVEHVPGRYTFHDLLRVYATELTHAHDTDEQRRTATTQMIEHYVGAAYAADRLLNPHRTPPALAPPRHDGGAAQVSNHAAAMTWLATEHRVLLAVLGQAAEGRFDRDAWTLAWALDTFLDRRGHWHDLATAWHVALPAARRLGDPAVQAEAHRRRAHASTRLGRQAAAYTHFQQALDLYTRAEDGVGQAQTHRTLAVLRERQGNVGEALHHSRTALALYEAAGDCRGQAAALNSVGWYHGLLGDRTRALTHCRQALTLFQQLGDQVGEAATWDSLGYANQHAGRHTEAADCYQHALTLYRNLDDRYEEATTATHLGDTHHTAGDHAAARAAWSQALHVLSELGHPDADSVQAKLHTLD